MPKGTIQSDVAYLHLNKLMGFRNDVGGASVTRRFVAPVPHVPTAAERLEAAKKARAEADQAIARLQEQLDREEQDRIERESTRATLVYTNAGEPVLEIRKLDYFVSFPVETWREVLKVAGEKIRKLDNEEIDSSPSPKLQRERLSRWHRTNDALFIRTVQNGIRTAEEGWAVHEVPAPPGNSGKNTLSEMYGQEKGSCG